MKNLEVSRFYQKRSKAAITFTVLTPVVIAILFVGVFAHSTPQQGGRDEIRIVLSSNGFAPSEVQHAPGSFAIAVENNILSGEYTLRLKAEDGTVLSEIQVQKGSSAWTVNLQTGRYTLTEVNHAQWSCSIVVQ